MSVLEKQIEIKKEEIIPAVTEKAIIIQGEDLENLGKFMQYIHRKWDFKEKFGEKVGETLCDINVISW